MCCQERRTPLLILTVEALLLILFAIALAILSVRFYVGNAVFNADISEAFA